MPVIRLYGFGNNLAVSSDILKFQTKFRQAAKDGSIPSELAQEVALVQVYSSAYMIMSEEGAQHVEIYASSETSDSDLIALAKFVKTQTIVGHRDIDIEIVWHDGTRTYFPKGKEIPASRPAEPST